MRQLSRRQVIQGTGTTAVAASLAGCSTLLGGDGGDGGDGGGKTTDGTAQKEEGPIKLGAQTILEGPATVFGVPSKKGGELAKKRINQAGGINGRKVEIEWVHEKNPIENYRRFVEKGYDATFGTTSSGRMKALAPEVESQGVVNIGFAGNFTDLFYGVTPNPKYNFRPSNMVLMQDMAAALAARDLVEGEITKIAGINPDYSAGHGSMNNFKAIMNKMTGGKTEVVHESYPQLLSGDYSTQISSAMDKNPDVVFTIFWGPDILTFANQAAAQGLFEDTPVINHYIYNQINDVSSDLVSKTNGNMIAGSRNTYWPHPDHSRYKNNRDFVKMVKDEYDMYPNMSFMEGYQSVTAWATAAAKGVQMFGSYPSQENLARILENHEYYTPMAYHKIRGDHTGLQPEFYGVLGNSEQHGVPVLKNKVQYGPEQVAPPQGKNPKEWRSSWKF